MKLLCALSLLSTAYSATPGPPLKLLPKPPMGFNNWARFQCALNQSIFTSTALALSSTGLLAAGYDRINIDDCWALYNRSSNGSLLWNSTLFPDGMPWLGQFLKSRGFKFGIYSDAGNLTCGGYPGSLGYEEIDAKTFESWGVDYLKLDGCNVDPITEARYKTIYSHWHSALHNLTHPLIFSQSAPAYFAPWQFPNTSNPNLTDWYEVMSWVSRYGELARHSDDIPTWDQPGNEAWPGIMKNYEQNTRFARIQRPNGGYFNDPDFLIVDQPGLTLEEVKSQFALWCVMGAPLLISAWVSGLSKDVVDVLGNKGLIEVDQDTSAGQAGMVARDDRWEVLSRGLENGDRVVAVLNKGAGNATLDVSFGMTGYVLPSWSQVFAVKDLWTGEVQKHGGGIVVDVPSHGTRVYRISADGSQSGSQRIVNVLPTGMVFNTASLNCLTSIKGNGTGTLSWSTCAYQHWDGQIWRINEDNSLSTLADRLGCLTSGGLNSTVTMKPCGRVAAQRWGYALSGNIFTEDKSGARSCLTEGVNGNVLMSACGAERNEQVFEMPNGSLQALGDDEIPI